MSVIARPAVPDPAASSPGTAGPSAVRALQARTRRTQQRAGPPGFPGSAGSLLRQARTGLAEAQWAEQSPERFVASYLAALRGAAAVLAVRGRPHRGRGRPTSAWVLLATVAPEYAEWATFFDSASATRAAVQSGITRGVTRRGADDLLRQSCQFVALVERAISDHASCVRQGR